MTTYTRGMKWAEAGAEVNESRNAQPEDRQFRLTADFSMTGDQPGAVSRLAEGVSKGEDRQTLLGVTGSGKTFTMANIVQQVQRPTLVMAHNKTLAAQLASEFKEFFPPQRRRVFRLLLRLLPAGGVRSAIGHVHREGLQRQRGTGQAATVGHDIAADATGRAHRGVGVVHLRPRRPPGLLQPRGAG